MTMFMVNSPRKKRRKKARTAAQKRATKKMLAARKRTLAGKKKRKVRTSTGGSSMARKRRKSSTVRRKRRRSSSKKVRRPTVTLRRRGVTVYQGNPKRKRRSRRGYRRNPSLVAGVFQQIKDGAAITGGGIAARIAGNFIPLADTGIVGVAKKLGVAVLVGFGARKVLGADLARLAGGGAMEVAIKGALSEFIPGSAPYLGAYDTIGAYALPSGVGEYMPNAGGLSGLYQGNAPGMGEGDYVEVE